MLLAFLAREAGLKQRKASLHEEHQKGCHEHPSGIHAAHGVGGWIGLLSEGEAAAHKEGQCCGCRPD